jgi:rfaE bifunctional protein kinase chain/domain
MGMMAMTKTVLVSGNFNVLHPGHLRLFRFARECADRLVVAVQSDRIAGKAAHVPQALRLEGVQSNSWVDEAIICDEPVADLIARIKPDVVVKGREHEHRFNPEKAAVESYGGDLLFSSGESLFSSIELLQRDFLQSSSPAIRVPVAYMQRHRIAIRPLLSMVKRYSKLRVCVVGDLIIDEYITCEPLGMSQEDPTIVVTPIDTHKFVGGAGIVAAHAAGLGAKVQFVSVTGGDEAHEFALRMLEKYGVEPHLIVDENRPTTLKQRYRSKGKTLLRVSHLRQTAIATELQEELLSRITGLLDACDVLVFSDFNYGCLPQAVVDAIIERARSRGVMMVADSQCSSQVGNVARFRGMDLITPTEHEARFSTRNHDEGLVVLANQLQQESDAKHIFLKLGEEGVLVHANVAEDQWLDDQLEALNAAPKDVAGAGDCMLITASMALALGAGIWEAAYVGSVAAAIQVGRVGNTPLQADELLQDLARLEAASPTPVQQDVA